MQVHLTVMDHPTSPRHKIIKAVTIRQRVYALTTAEPYPASEEEVVQIWREERKKFRPYDESTGRYLC